jgi:molybdopterin-containing oxidoreductase family membrane subunit
MNTSYFWKPAGASGWLFWLQAFGNILAPQFFWLRRVRNNAWCSLLLCTVILIPDCAAWLIVYLTKHGDFLPSSWQH